MKNDLLFLTTWVFPFVSVPPPLLPQQGRGQPGRQRHQWQFYQHAEHANVLGKSENNPTNQQQETGTQILKEKETI